MRTTSRRLTREDGGTVSHFTAPSGTLGLHWERAAREPRRELAMEHVIYLLIAIVLVPAILASLSWHPRERA